VTSIIECPDQIPAIGFVELLHLLTTVFVQVFGRRHDEPFHALWRPASKKRQGTKSRTYAGAEPRALWGFCRRFGLAEAGL
jgi:hypothetical protein